MIRLAQRFRDLIPNQKFLQSVTLLAGSTVIGQIINVLSIPVLTRLYTREDLGILGLVVSFASIAAVAVTLKYELAIVSASTDFEARDLMLTSLVAGFVLSVVASGVFIILQWVGLLGFGGIPLIFTPLIFCLTLLLAYTGVLKYWLTRQEAFEQVGQMNLVQNIVKAIAQIALFPISSLGLVVGESLGRGIGLLRSWKTAKINLLLYDLYNKKTQFTASLRKYRTFPMFVLPSSFLDILGVMLPLPIIAGLYGVAAAGEFSMAQRVVSIPLALVGGSVADVFHSQIANLQRSEPRKIAGSFLNMALMLFLVGVIPTFILGFFGGQLFSIILGSEWQIAGVLVSVMCPWMLAQFIVSPISRLVLLSHQQFNKLIFDGIALSLVFLVPNWAHQARMPLEQTLQWLSLALMSAYFIYFGILYRLALQLSRCEA